MFSLLITGFLITKPRIAAESVKGALSLCVTGLIPSLFPFIVTVGIIDSSGLSVVISKLLGRPIEFFFSVPREAVSAVILGAVGGFPIGAVCVRRLYISGSLTKDEAERLLCFTNNASPAFCIGVIGISLFNSTGFGVRLFLCQLAAAIIIGLFGRRRTHKSHATTPAPRNSVSQIITSSIGDGGITMLKICSFAVFFAVAGDVICLVCQYYIGTAACTMSAAVTELTLAARKCAELGGTAGKLICAFAVGFSGMSVHLQTASVLSDCDISMSKYYKAKLMQGILCAVFVLISCQASSAV